MTTYETIDSAWETLEEFDGAEVLHPKYQCKLCGEPIEKSYLKTSERCYYCNSEKMKSEIM
jgi:predicted Zn-ribbon and HTH transcriptional regulator